jgi:hypothetical protein
MNPDMLSAFLKQTFGNMVKTGVTQGLEDFADTLPPEQLSKLIAVLQKVERRKRGTLDAKGTPSAR